MLSLRQSNEIIKAIKIEKKQKTSHGQWCQKNWGWDGVMAIKTNIMFGLRERRQKRTEIKFFPLFG